MAPNQSSTVRAARDQREGKPPKTSKKELVILTGISGAGKASASKAFEDLGYQAVDNLPLELMPEFAGLVEKSKEIRSRGHRRGCARRPGARSACQRSSSVLSGSADDASSFSTRRTRAGAAVL